MTSGATVALRTKDLKKSYGRQVALAGLDLEVPTGVVYGFLGPNGAGKTTTMRILTGLIRPNSGTISMMGQPFDRTRRDLLHHVGSLIEAPSFYPHLSARNNLRVLGATGLAVSNARVEELLELVGLRDRANDRVSRYSMGMKQRLGIAVALLNDPELLLLDEPANGLDPSGIVGLRDTLKALAASGKTVLISSHILPEVQQMADIVGIVAAGRLITQGPLDELLTGQAIVRVRVRPDEVAGANAILTRIAGESRVEVTDPEAAWLVAHVAADKATDVNRALAEAGIYASGLEGGSDLESLFLQLTAPPAPPPSAAAPGTIPGWNSGAAS
ncbi:MAG TPA: ATP-binding cassette domain-containing protein [Candidatus Limnocylindrales bacterium]